MARDDSTYVITAPDGSHLLAQTTWTVSRGYETYGYNICTLRVNRERVAHCNGGGYDMVGTVFGTWFAALPEAQEALAKLVPAATTHYDVTYTKRGKRVEKYWNTEYTPRATEHTVPDNYGLTRIVHHDPALNTVTLTFRIDGACGYESVRDIMEHCGYSITRL